MIKQKNKKMKVYLNVCRTNFKIQKKNNKMKTY